MSAVTTDRVTRDFVHPAMDARALNLAQQRLLANDTPEIDCVADVGNALVSSHPDLAAALLGLAARLAASNQEEGECARMIAGNAERLAAESRVRSALSVKGLARVLLPLLDAYESAPASSAARLRAGRDVRWLLGPEPPPSLASELGDARVRQLHCLLGQEVL